MIFTNTQKVRTPTGLDANEFIQRKWPVQIVGGYDDDVQIIKTKKNIHAIAIDNR